MATSYKINPLAGDAVKKLHTDKGVFTRAFINSQRQHASAYALEGKKEFKKWKESFILDGNSQHSKPAQNVKPTSGGGFSSPVLKPRNATCPSIVQMTFRKSSEELPSSKEEKRRKTVARKEARNASRAQYDKNATKQREQSNLHSEERQKPKLPQKPGTKAQDRSYSDVEREERLAQRRARRQRKKEIVKPRAHEKDTEPDSGDEREPPGVLKKTKSKKKDRESKLPAGLALMHGFSAENIGKHRLTMGPRVTVGVFNKGRASMKIKVEKKKTRKAPITFDESDFLNRCALPKRMSKQADCDSSTEPSESPNKRRKVIHTQDPAGTESASSISIIVSKPSSSGPLADNISTHDEKSSYESEVWEIEKEFLQSSGADEKSQPDAPGKLESIVINSRTWGWSVSEAAKSTNKHASNAPIPAIEDKGREEDSDSDGSFVARSVTTIEPSQSVSQVAAKSPAAPDISTDSKFFMSLKQSEYVDEDPRHDNPKPLSHLERGRPSFVREDCKDSASFGPNEEVKGAGNSEILHVEKQVKELTSDHRTSCSLENAIQLLEDDGPGTYANQPEIPREHHCLSVLGTEFTIEETREQYDIELIAPDDLDSRYDVLGPYEMTNDYQELHQAEFIDISCFPEYDSQDLHDEGSIQNSFYSCNYFNVPVNDYCRDHDYDNDGPNSHRIWHLETEPLVSKEPCHPLQYQDPVDYELDEHDAELCSIMLYDKQDSTHSYCSSASWNGDLDSSYSEELQEVGRYGSFISEVKEECLPQGHLTLCGARNLKNALRAFEDRPITPKACAPASSLEEAEATVAKEFQKSFYPIRF